MVVAVVLGFILDLVIGDPEPHPIRLVGKIAGVFDRIFNRPASGARLKKTAGVLAVLILVLSSYAGTFLLIKTVANYSAQLSFALTVIIVAYTLSLKSLRTAAFKVKQALDKNDLKEARSAVRALVGRDVDWLDKESVAKAAVESTAENLGDGIIAPLFYALLLGAPGAVAYKVINTLDSMWGYKNQKYRYFGWAAAKLDDLANFIPARLSSLTLTLAAPLMGGNMGNAWRAALRQARFHASPNAGWPEAAMAGALDIRLGGERTYEGKLLALNPMGFGGTVSSAHIAESCKLAFVSAIIFLIIGTAIRLSI